MVSVIGFGCWQIGGHGWGATEDAESSHAVRRALELGIDLFDTAAVYGFGHSEKVLAEALGAERGRVALATKGGLGWDASGRVWRDASPTALLESLHESLRRLRIETIPIYQLHWPDQNLPLEESIETLERAREAGKILWIGCCNCDAAQAERVAAFPGVVVLQNLYNLLDQDIEESLLPQCERWGLGMMTHTSLAMGLLSGKYASHSTFPKAEVLSRSKYLQTERKDDVFEEIEAVRRVAARVGVSESEVAIRWILENPSITSALVGMRTAEQLDQNVLASRTLEVGRPVESIRQLVAAERRAASAGDR